MHGFCWRDSGLNALMPGVTRYSQWLQIFSDTFILGPFWGSDDDDDDDERTGQREIAASGGGGSGAHTGWTSSDDADQGEAGAGPTRRLF